MVTAQFAEHKHTGAGTRKTPASFYDRRKTHRGAISDDKFIAVTLRILDRVSSDIKNSARTSGYRGPLSPFMDTTFLEFPRLTRTHTGPEAQRLERVSELSQVMDTRPLTKPEVLELKRIGWDCEPIGPVFKSVLDTLQSAAKKPSDPKMLKLTLQTLGDLDTISDIPGSSRLFHIIIDRELPQPIRMEAMAEIRRQAEGENKNRAKNAAGILRYFREMGEEQAGWAKEELAKLK